MEKLVAEVSRQDDILKVHFSGKIDEDAVFPKLDLSGVKTLAFDFEGLTLINSCGIRDWVSWLKGLPQGLSGKFERCPQIIVDQINMINGFIPEGWKVESFYVPYYSDDSDELYNKLVVRGIDYQGEDCKIESKIVVPTGGHEAEIDVIVQKYFKFLKNFG